MTVMKMNTVESPVSPEDAAIGRAVHEAIYAHRVTQDRVYSALGISRSSLIKKMRGEVRWFARDLVIVAAVIGVAPADLLPPITAPNGVTRR